MNQQIGRGSLCFSEAPFIIGTASVVGTKEGEGPIASEFDCIGEDDKFGQDTWEEAESCLQQEALTLALGKADKTPEEMRYLFAGDLLGQLIASSFGLKSFEIPLFGLYGACSTCGEALALSAMTVAAGYADHVAAVTSSHFASAEKQFRFPLEYANQRNMDRHRCRGLHCGSCESGNPEQAGQGFRQEGRSLPGSFALHAPKRRSDGQDRRCHNWQNC